MILTSLCVPPVPVLPATGRLLWGPPLRPTIFLFFFVFLAFCVALWWCARTTAESAPEPEQGRRGAFSRKVFYLTFEKKTRGALGRKPDLRLMLSLPLSFSLWSNLPRGHFCFFFLLSNFCFVSNLCVKNGNITTIYIDITQSGNDFNSGVPTASFHPHTNILLSSTFCARWAIPVLFPRVSISDLYDYLSIFYISLHYY